jgi:hypothetical protein
MDEGQAEQKPAMAQVPMDDGRHTGRQQVRDGNPHRSEGEKIVAALKL